MGEYLIHIFDFLFVGDYEYFRENAWQALNVLEYYLKNVKYT